MNCRISTIHVRRRVVCRRLVSKLMMRSGWGSAVSRQSFLFLLPLEIRRFIYQLVLGLGHYVSVSSGSGGGVKLDVLGKPEKWVSLVYVNRQVSIEARVVLYESNEFFFDGYSEVVEKFLEKVGVGYASLIRSVRISFPGAVCVAGLKNLEVRLADESVRLFGILVEYCRGLRELHMCVSGSGRWNIPISPLAEQVAQGEVQKGFDVLGEMDVYIRKIGHLKRIVVCLDGSSSSGAVLQFMRELGWQLSFE